MSRQVRAEAEHIFHNDNLFVLFTLNRITPNPELDAIFWHLIEPVVLARGEVARSFKHHAISLDLDFSQPMAFELPILLVSPGNHRLEIPISLMIAGEDVPWLVRVLGFIDGVFKDGGRPLLQDACLSISALGPPDGRSQDYHKLRKLQKPLLHLRGIKQASLNATVSAEYEHRFIESIQEPRLGVVASADKAKTFIRTGNKAFRCGRYLQAIYAYQEALDFLPFFYGFRDPWTTGGDGVRAIPTEIPTKLYIKLFNLQRAARIRLEIERKALQLSRSAKAGANRPDRSAKAGVVYAIANFSNNWHGPDMNGASFEYEPDICRSSWEYWRDRVGLDVQLDIIINFESDPCMKKALRTSRASRKKGNPFTSIEISQFPSRIWDGWLLEI